MRAGVSDQSDHVRRHERSRERDDARRDDNKVRDYRALEELNTQPAITYLRDLYREKGKA